MKKRLNPARLKRPTEDECRKACQVLMSEHLFLSVDPETGRIRSGGLERMIQGGPEVAVFTVSGRLIREFEQLLERLANDVITMRRKGTAIDVKPASDSELQELRKIAGLEATK